MSHGGLDQLQRSVQDPQTQVVSVDVFDTLLLRDTIPESARFKAISALQANVLNDLAAVEISPTSLYLLRREAARTVYWTKTRRSGGREASWREIFQLMFDSLGVPVDEKWFALCAAQELRYEQERLRLNWPLSELLKDAQDRGKAVVCMSDMYLSSEQIKHLIDTSAGCEQGLPIYSSADHGFGKGCGALYRKLAGDYSSEFPQIFHCGDNWYSDFIVPQSLGIRAQFLPRTKTWRMARKMRSYIFDLALPAL